jgi:hypothetical protein
MTAMGYEGAAVYPGHYYGGGCEDTRQHTWGGYHQQVAHPQGSPSQRYPYYDTRYTFLDTVFSTMISGEVTFFLYTMILRTTTMISNDQMHKHSSMFSYKDPRFSTVVLFPIFMIPGTVTSYFETQVR